MTQGIDKFLEAVKTELHFRWPYTATGKIKEVRIYFENQAVHVNREMDEPQTYRTPRKSRRGEAEG